MLGHLYARCPSGSCPECALPCAQLTLCWTAGELCDRAPWGEEVRRVRIHVSKDLREVLERGIRRKLHALSHFFAPDKYPGLFPVEA